MNLFNSKFVFVLPVLVGVACGGSIAPVDPDASTGADAAKLDGSIGSDAFPPPPPPFDAGLYDFCKEAAARASKCGDGFNPTDCAQQAACFAGAMRPQSALNVEQCFTQSPCQTMAWPPSSPVSAVARRKRSRASSARRR